MNSLLFLFLSLLCLDLAVSNMTITNTTQKLHSTTSKSTGEKKITLMQFATSTKTIQRQMSTVASSTRNNTSTGSTPTSTKTNLPQPHGQKMVIVGIVILLKCILIILLVVLLRWYCRNPEHRIFRGLCGRLAERLQLAWVAVATRLRPAHKQPGDEEAGDAGMEGGQEGVNGGMVVEEERRKEDEEEDDSSDDYSSMETENVKEGEERGKMEEEEEEKEDDGVGEEMAPVPLGNETDTEEDDDVTPL